MVKFFSPWAMSFHSPGYTFFSDFLPYFALLTGLEVDAAYEADGDSLFSLEDLFDLRSNSSIVLA